VVILCGGECWLFSSFLLSFPGILLFPPVCGFALLVLVKLCSLVSLSLLLDLSLAVGRVIWTIFIVFVFLPMEV